MCFRSENLKNIAVINSLHSNINNNINKVIYSRQMCKLQLVPHSMQNVSTRSLVRCIKRRALHFELYTGPTSLVLFSWKTLAKTCGSGAIDKYVP